MAPDERKQRTQRERSGAIMREKGQGSSVLLLIERLEELRWRILKVLAAIIAGSVLAFLFRDPIVELLVLPFPLQGNALLQEGQRLVVMGITEGLTVFLKISLAVGFVIALPVILYQTWAFLMPEPLQREKKSVLLFLLIGILLFFAGVSLGYLVIRYPLAWLVAFASESFTELIRAESYFGFVAIFLLTFGFIFEIPLVLTSLAQVGIVTPETLKRKRSVAHFGLWVAATFLMPGADIWSPIILGASMSGLYELTFLLIRFLKKQT